MIAAISAVIPTANRAIALQVTFESIAKQNLQPAEIIIVDASENDETEKLCRQQIPNLQSAIIYKKAIKKGAAVQRNQGVENITNPVIFFCDDDVRLEPFCIERLYNCLLSDERIGGVNGTVMNQRYHTPGKFSRFMYRLQSGEKLGSYAGKIIGPAWNLLPEDRDDMPEMNEIEWLNTTCTLYRREAVPIPPFPNLFRGYSLMEDVYLSLIVARKWKLYNARTARLYHDSQPGTHKNKVFDLAKMEIVNRHFIMTKLLKRNKISDYCKLFLFEAVGITNMFTNIAGLKRVVQTIAGMFAGVITILFTKQKYE